MLRACFAEAGSNIEGKVKVVVVWGGGETMKKEDCLLHIPYIKSTFGKTHSTRWVQ